MARIMNRAVSLFCLLSCMAHCTCFIANCMRLCFIYVNRVAWAAAWPYGSAEPHDISPSVFLSKRPHLNECVLSQTWPRPALQILAWKPASAAPHGIYPSGIGGQEEEGRFAPLRSLSLCRFYTQTHGVSVCASVSSGPSVSRCPIWNGLGSAGLGCVSCRWWMALTWWSLWGLAGCAVGVSHQPSPGSVWH